MTNKKKKGNNTPRHLRQQHPQQTEQAMRTLMQAGYSVTQEVYRSGPLPDPDELAKYEQAHPGAAKWIFDQAAIQGQHRRDLEKRNLEAAIKRSSIGMWLGFVLSVAVVAAGFVLLLRGREVWGFATMISALVALAGVFVYGRWSQSRERLRKLGAG
ncbi:MAG TPA: DUF2335 domain-containing protein [Actinomycetota bacterium]|nr:DUF2335 domain-containing protein [Actinomycetota bacterium]